MLFRSKLELVTSEITDTYLNMSNVLSDVRNGTNTSTLSWLVGTGECTEEDFAALTFQIKDDVEAGTEIPITVTLHPQDIYDEDEQDIAFTAQNGAVVVPAYLPGDINGDGSVNNKDVTRLFRYVSGWDVEVVEAALDVNGDGSVNNKDVTRLFRYVSGWDVVIQ